MRRNFVRLLDAIPEVARFITRLSAGYLLLALSEAKRNKLRNMSYNGKILITSFHSVFSLHTTTISSCSIA